MSKNEVESLRAAEECLTEWVTIFERTTSLSILELAERSRVALSAISGVIAKQVCSDAKILAAHNAGWSNLSYETKGENAGRLYGIPPHEPTFAFVGHEFVDDWKGESK